MRQKLLQKKWLLYCSLAVLIWLPYNNYAQSVKRQCISSYGSVVLTDSLIIAQTVGQCYNTIGSSENSTAILQGFQQPNTFSIEDVSSLSFKNLNLTVYPNPANYSVSIKSEELIENSIVNVTDLNGKLILSEQVTQLLIYDINCAAWENGTYIITVSDINQNKSSLKLIINK